MITTIGLQIPQLGHSHQELLDQCLMQILSKASRNRVRRQYYDYKNALRDLGIAIPPQLRSVETVVGWPAKGVDGLSRRLNLDGFTIPGGNTADLGLDAILADNRFEIEAPQAHTSALVSSVAFTAVTAGDVLSGEPEVIISARSAEHATGIWDGRRRSLKAALFIYSVDDAGAPDDMALLTPDTAIMIKKTATGWDVRESRHSLGSVPVEPLIYNPSLDRPFGRSRISRAVMALTDSAVRTLLRSEVSAEFFSAPQRAIMGADEDAFIGPDGNPIPAWQSLIGRVLAIGRDEDGNIPTVQQFSQQTMQPHFDQLRGLASMFASEVNLPVSSLGIVQDNPASAEAIFAAKEDMIIDAKYTIRSFSPSWERQARRALSMLDNSPTAMAQYEKIRSHWVDPSTPSVVSASDAMSKQISVFPWMADSEVALEGFGYDQATIERLMADKRRAGAGAMLANLTAATAGLPGEQSEALNSADDATAMKAKFDALGVAIRAGVDPDDAANRLGLSGIAFTGAVPVSLRLPERDTSVLEDK